uniref:Uncharacterized protein n=1 Tax=Candidatus Kentrum sp. TUN TaxID=2126343 RepID=A0A451A7J1_9GAMM|nr:MAG: hypothetical protein BECKTUN1418D_GA0071000_11661 [Candidatus Kentron sp. TUN]
MFDEEYLDSLPSEPILALDKVVNEAIDKWNSLTEYNRSKEYEFFLEAFTIIQAISANVEELKVSPDILLESTPKEVVQKIIDFCESVKIKISKCKVRLKSEQLQNKYQAKFGNVFAYEFSKGDLERIQRLINELRDTITASELFEEQHKQRLLARLEKIQSELHKKVSDLDHLWGLVGDAGVVFGKFGESAKPFVDRIREIANITWRTQSRAEELPSDTPMSLISNDDNKANK